MFTLIAIYHKKYLIVLLSNLQIINRLHYNFNLFNVTNDEIMTKS